VADWSSGLLALLQRTFSLLREHGACGRREPVLPDDWMPVADTVAQALWSARVLELAAMSPRLLADAGALRSRVDAMNPAVRLDGDELALYQHVLTECCRVIARAAVTSLPGGRTE
jgi:hypothetical protein